MSTEVVMPQMGESIAEGTITRWLKKVGEHVERDEPLFEISTDKVDAEIPSPAAGTLIETRFKEGDTVAVNTVVAVIGDANESAAAPQAAERSPTHEQTQASTPPPVPTSTPAPPPISTSATAASAPSAYSATATAPASETAPSSPPPSVPQGDGANAPIPPPVSTATSAPPASTQTSAPTIPPPVASTDAQGANGQAAQTAAEAKDRSAMTAEELRRTRSSPLVRNIAKEYGVDISQIEGTGMSGRVTKNDILHYIESGAPQTVAPTAHAAAPTAETAATTAPITQPSAPPTQMPTQAPPIAQAHAPSTMPPTAQTQPPQTPMPQAAMTQTPPAAQSPAISLVPQSANAPMVMHVQPSEGDRVEPMSVMRRRIAEHMVLSKRTSAHVTTVYEIDMTKIVKLREQMKNSFYERTGTKLTYMPFIFQAVTQAIRKFPIFNAQVAGDQIIYKRDINLGMAVALDWGLIVPVIKRADELSIAGLARTANDLADRARAKQLKPDEVQGGTFTITNPGVFGGLYGTPIINQPQVAILAIGAIEKRPKVITNSEGDDYIAIRSMAYFALSYDHRIIDGADAERFLSYVKQILEAGQFSL
jgi:pyruvate dehydrogenase E2 component (dihydrolipoamide acetyltransferase)